MRREESARAAVERFLPKRDSIRWELDIRGQDKPWSTPIETRIHWPEAEQRRFWTSWGYPQAKREAWFDPLTAVPFVDRRFLYGGNAPYKDANTFSVPLFSVLDGKRDAGLSVVVSPEDLLIGLELATTARGDVTCSRLYHRLDKSNVDGLLLDSLRGRRWLLLPHVVRVEGDKALANIFEVPGGYVVPVTFAGKARSVQVVLRGLPRLPGQGPFRIEALQPGESQPVPASATDEGGVLRIDVPLKRGCAVLLVTHTWMEPKTAYFIDTLTVRLGSMHEAARLHYTLDGSEPTAKSPEFTGPIELRHTTVVRAAAFLANEKVGDTLQREYVRVQPSPAGRRR